MYKKPNLIQQLFVKVYFKTYKKLVDKALSNNHYVVTMLYSHDYKFAILMDEVETWLKEFDDIGFKWVVINNVIFIW